MESDPDEKARAQERELIIKSRDGDVDAFAELIRLYRNMVYKICYGAVWDAGEAEDLEQNTYLGVWKALGHLDPDRVLGPYISKVAKNCCNSWWRKELRRGPFAWRKLESTDEVLEGVDGRSERVLERIVDRAGSNPEMRVIIKQATEQAMKRLSLDHRNLLWQLDILGYSPKRIAKIRRCTVENVYHHIRRARAMSVTYFLEEWNRVFPQGSDFS